MKEGSKMKVRFNVQKWCLHLGYNYMGMIYSKSPALKFISKGVELNNA